MTPLSCSPQIAPLAYSERMCSPERKPAQGRSAVTKGARGSTQVSKFAEEVGQRVALLVDSHHPVRAEVTSPLVQVSSVSPTLTTKLPGRGRS